MWERGAFDVHTTARDAPHRSHRMRTTRPIGDGGA